MKLAAQDICRPTLGRLFSLRLIRCGSVLVVATILGQSLLPKATHAASSDTNLVVSSGGSNHSIPVLEMRLAEARANLAAAAALRDAG